MKEVFVYRIDQADIITSVCDNWKSFATDNAWAGECSPENVVGHVLWDFIQDRETRHLYMELFKIVRAGKGAGPIPFRCDSPRERRFLELLLSPLPDGRIEITSTIIRSEPRDHVKLLDNQTPRSGELVKICSMCKKIAVAEDEWVEMEEGLARLKLFEADKMPGLTHGLCLPCYRVALAEHIGSATPTG